MNNSRVTGCLKICVKNMRFFAVFVILGFQQGVPIFLIYAYHSISDVEPQGRFPRHTFRGIRSGVILIPVIAGWLINTDQIQIVHIFWAICYQKNTGEYE